MSKDDTAKTIMWEENSCKHSHDPLDCFLGGKDCDSSNEFVGESNDVKYAQVGTYIVEKMKRLMNSDDYVKLRQEEEPRLPVTRVNHSQIELGELLGGGAFSNVFEIKTCLSEELDSSLCVVKVLRKRVIENPKLFAACAIGLLREGSILASLNHENIINVRAFSQAGPSGYATGRNDACFIILDRLDEMLSSRLEEWKHSACNLKGFIRHRQQKNRVFLIERLQVSRQLASAVAYLHQRSIVHRDIKPNNIGLDSNGTLKLFDFDVSRILPKETYEDQTFRLTKTGTKRYMSPECGLGETYNQKTDVYSFALMLHQIISLEVPYEELDMFEIKRKVFLEGLRPKINMSWPNGIKRLLKQSWSVHLHTRPSMATVHSSLKLEIEKLQEPTTKKRFGLIRSSKILTILVQ
jgi:serine/threonine protein kinase